MRQEHDIAPPKDDLDAADRASRDIRRQVEQARRRLLSEYREILRDQQGQTDQD